MAQDDPIVLDAGQQQIDGFVVDLDLHLSSRASQASALEKVTALLMQLGAVHEQVRAVIIRDFQTLPQLKDCLLPDLFTLDESYRAALFPDRVDVSAATPNDLLHALTMCRVGYYDHYDVSGSDTGEALIVDYRFLVTDLTPDDMARQDMFLRFGNRYDITNQIVTARVAMDGALIDLSVES